MAGSVGGAVAGSPGYSGYVPSSQQPLTTTHSLVTERKPVELRCKPCQPEKTKLADSLPAVDERPVDPTEMFLPKRFTAGTVYSTDAKNGTRVNRATWVQPRTKAALVLESQRRDPATASSAKFQATSLYSDASARLDQNKDQTFYSKLRMKEQQDTDKLATVQPSGATRSGAKMNLPTEVRLKKRMECEDLEPPKPAFVKTETRSLLGVDPVSASDFVKFQGAHECLSSTQREYGVRGSTPTHLLCSDPLEMTRRSTTADLFAGTTKSALGLRIPGYMGFVPSKPETLKKMKGDDDLKRQNSHNVILLSSGRKTMPGYSGHEPRSLYNDTGKPNAPPSEMTTTGRFTQTAVTGEAEKGMNKPEHAKKAGIRKFFSQGGGQSDNTIADQYFVKYRPMEGLLKMGPPAERTIPGTGR